MAIANKELISRLQKDILQWEGYKPPENGRKEILGLGPLELAFPNGVFPKSCVHEVVCANREQAAAAGGFISGVISLLMQQGGIGVWIGSTKRFAPALAGFKVAPHNIIFINLRKDEELLWVMEEALKCPGLTAVICETKELTFKQSQRLQRAVENSRVTGFVLRNAVKLNSTACAARWQITSLPTTDMGGLPGLGFLRWKINLLKVRNGQTGSYILEWNEGYFMPVQETIMQEERQVG
jgi:protein ImuA